MLRFLVASALVLTCGSKFGTLLSAEELTEAPRPTPEQVAFFESKIRPVLVTHCAECHSSTDEEGEPLELQGGLSIENRASLLKGGDSGPAIVPGEPEASLLLDALRYGDDSYQMPPEGKLPAHVIKDFEAWIKDGAADPRDGSAVERKGIDLAAGRQFWSFRPLTNPTPPATGPDAWSESPIDAFLEHRWQALGLTPADDASREVLLRRLCFDLTGLPPSAELRERFLSDTAPDAWTRLVDELLASPQFGERWGRHWLDVVRYAESSGGGRTLLFRDAWRFRDYVVDSFNADKPYADLVREHLAGDLLAESRGGSLSEDERNELLTATGFLTLGPTNYELQDKPLLRMEVVDEQVDTTGRAFLGMTIGCARCHDHKFDPVPQADYYALAGIFRSTQTLTPGNVNGFVTRNLSLPEAERKKYDAYVASVKALDADIAKLKARQKELEKLAYGKPKSGPLQGIVVDETKAEFVGEWNVGKLTAHVGKEYRFAQPGDAKAIFRVATGKAGEYAIRLVWTANPNRSSRVRVDVESANFHTGLVIDQRKAPRGDGRGLTIATHECQTDENVVITVSAKDSDGVVIVDGVQLVHLGTYSDPDRPTKLDAARLEELDDESAGIFVRLERLEGKKKSLQKNAPPGPPQVMSVKDQTDAKECGDTELRIRGDIRNLGPLVPRGFLSVVEETPPTIPTGTSGRLELADWIASEKNPLTARVMANRVWRHLFGRGLVPTPDNFGITGTPPSHPELLDHLASRLIANEYSVKRLIREVVLSRAYRLSESTADANRTRDPDNTHFARRTRRRLEAEAIRDTMLHAAGTLDARMHGPSIRSGTRSELGYKFDPPRPDLIRRSVYVPVFRNAILDLFAVFDVANPNLVQGQRTASTLPTQALLLMNSPFVRDQAARAAERVLAKTDDQNERVTRLWLRTLARKPTAAERQVAEDFLSKSATDAEAFTSLAHSLFACVDFRYVR